MRIIIVGDGKVGSILTSQLSKEGHEVVVIDKRSNVLKNAENREDVLTIVGNGADLNVLKEAGAGSSDLIIAVTNADEVNILCCLVAKKLGCKHTIARVRNPEYSSQLVFMRDELGLSMSINPELAAAREIKRLVAYPSALKVESFLSGRIELIEIKLTEGNPLIGTPLSQIHAKYKAKVLVCAIKRGGEILIPKGDVVLQEKDKITITGSMSDMTAFFRKIGIIQNRIRNVMIVGGGKISYYLAERLLESGSDVTIVEQNHERCLELCDILPKAHVIHGDGADSELLLEEGMAEMDAVISLTGMDEENVMISLYATRSGVKKVIAKVDRMPHLEILEEIGVDTVISPKNITSTQIVHFVRSMVSQDNSTLQSLYRIADGDVEALEFVIPTNAKGYYLHKAIKYLSFKDNMLLAAISRSGTVILPRGDDTIEPGDHVIVVTTHTGLSNIEDIFSEV